MENTGVPTHLRLSTPLRRVMSNDEGKSQSQAVAEQWVNALSTLELERPRNQKFGVILDVFRCFVNPFLIDQKTRDHQKKIQQYFNIIYHHYKEQVDGVDCENLEYCKDAQDFLERYGSFSRVTFPLLPQC